MRLQTVGEAHSRVAKVFQRVARLVFGHEMDGVAKVAMHRPELFGRPFLALVHDVLREPSFWTAAEREYMAAFTSRQNECPFCARVHGETTRVESGWRLDPESHAGIRPELAAVLPLLAKLSRTPEDVAPHDVDSVRAAGVPDDAIVDALHVNFVFNLVNRMANTLGWTWDSDDHVRAGAKAIHRFSYELPGFVMR
ncbi:MAG: hypothetical protein ACLGI2_04320 [Acidimicrobiia bacterium]